MATSGPAIDWLEPTARNSKRLPVKAKGLVRLRSPASLGSGGRTSTPTVSVPLPLEAFAPPALICSKMSVNWSPRKTEMIAGGASLAPRRWSLPAWATTARSRAAVLVDCPNNRRAEDEELHVGVRRVAGVQEVALAGAAQRPVDVLARAVDAGEGLLVQQAGHAVLLRHAAERDHDELLVVGGDVGRLEDRARSRTGPGPLRCGGS